MLLVSLPHIVFHTLFFLLPFIYSKILHGTDKFPETVVTHTCASLDEWHNNLLRIFFFFGQK